MFSVKSKVEQLKMIPKIIYMQMNYKLKAAIQRETHLADESPEAQAIQKQKKQKRMV